MYQLDDPDAQVVNARNERNSACFRTWRALAYAQLFRY